MEMWTCAAWRPWFLGVSHQCAVAAEVFFILPWVIRGGVPFHLLGSILAQVIGGDVTYDPAELCPPPVRWGFGVDEQSVSVANAQLRDTNNTKKVGLGLKFAFLKNNSELLHHETPNLFAAVCGKVTHGDVLLRRQALAFTFIFCLHGKRTGLFGRGSVPRRLFSVRPVIVREYHSPFLNNADLARREMSSKHFHHASVKRRCGNVGHFLFWCDVTSV